jgi:hypothetical protein
MSKEMKSYRVYHAGSSRDHPIVGGPTCFVLVAIVRASSVTDVFTLTNDTGDEDYWWEHPDVLWARIPARSTSVGDLIVEEHTGMLHRVASVGFEHLVGE